MSIFVSIKRFIVRSCLDLLKLYIDMYLYLTKKQDNIIKNKDFNGSNEYKMTKYDIIKNNKMHSVIFSLKVNDKTENSKIEEELEKHILDFKMNTDIVLSNKNLIVNCTLNKYLDIEACNEKDQTDITNSFRYFCYYFDKDIKVDIFLEYLKLHENIDYNNYSCLTIYMNDFDFSERVYDLERLKDIKFSSLLSN